MMEETGLMSWTSNLESSRFELVKSSCVIAGPIDSCDSIVTC